MEDSSDSVVSDHHQEIKLLRWYYICGFIESFLVAMFVTFYDLHSSNVTPFTTGQRYFMQENFWSLQILMAIFLVIYALLKCVSFFNEYPDNRIPRLFYVLFIVGEFCIFYENKHFFRPSFLSRTIIWLTGLIYHTLHFGFSMELKDKSKIHVWHFVAATLLALISLHLVFIAMIQILVEESVKAFCGNNALILLMTLLFCIEDLITYLRIANPERLTVNTSMVAIVKCGCWCE